MSPVRIYGDQGYVELEGAAQSTNTTFVLPSGTGTSGQVIQTDGAGNLSYSTPVTSNLTRFTAESISSGTTSVTFDLTSVSDVAAIRKITVLIDNVGKSANSTIIIQLGDSGGIEATGYSNGAAFINTAGNADCDNGTTTGFAVRYGGTDNDTSLYKIDNITGNSWIGSCTTMAGTGASAHYGAGRKSLSGACTQLRVQASSGTMDSGTINVIVET